LTHPDLEGGPLTITFMDPSLRKAQTQLITSLPIPMDAILIKSLLWGTLSNALQKSMYIISTGVLLSR
jgi:hypothetical protein